MFACLVSIHSKMWIQQQTSFLHQRLVSLAWFWCYGGSYLFQKYSSLHSRSLNNICTAAIPGQILARYCSWRAVERSHRLHSPHNPKPQRGHFNNSTTRRPRSEKPLQTLGSRTFFSFSCFSIAYLEAVSQYVTLLLRIKALALQKQPLFFLFAGKNCRHLGCRNIMRSRGCAVQNKGFPFTLTITNLIGKVKWERFF